MAASPRASLGFATIALLVGSLLLGFAHIALLPPWEGFDENAHYAYVEQMAATGSWPRFDGPISADGQGLCKVAPGPWPTAPAWSSAALCAAPRAVVEGGRGAVWSPRDPARAWRPGKVANWEAQHPPLYYGLLLPAFRLTQGWSLAAQLAL